MSAEELAGHRDRAAQVLPDATGLTIDIVEHFRHHVLPDLDDEQVRSVTIALAERASRYRGWAWEAARLFPALAGRQPAWTPADVELLFDLAHQASEYSTVTVLRVATGAAERLDPADRGTLVERFRWAQKLVDACYAVLGRRADADAIAALVRLQRGTRHRGKLKQIAAALGEAAAGAGVSRSELTELGRS